MLVTVSMEVDRDLPRSSCPPGPPCAFWSVLWLLHHLSFSALVVLQLFFQVALVFLPPVQSARSNNDLADAGRRKRGADHACIGEFVAVVYSARSKSGCRNVIITHVNLESRWHA